MKKWILLLLCLALALSLPLSAYAAPADPSQSASLTLEYQYEGQRFEGLEIRIFRVASVAANVFDMELVEPFADYPIDLSGVISTTEWNVIRQTLEAYVWADGLEPTAIGYTDAEGRVLFDNLETGLYLVMPVFLFGEEVTTEFFGFLTILPTPQDDGSMEYDVTAYPKSAQYNIHWGDHLPLRVVKQWKDEGFEEYRPASVPVDVYRNGAFVGTVALSAENDWSYSWVVEDNGDVWTVVEREIPEEYTVTIELIDDVFVLTNVRDGYTPPPPSGDTTVLWPYILGMCLSGCLIVLVALARKREKR